MSLARLVEGCGVELVRACIVPRVGVEEGWVGCTPERLHLLLAMRQYCSKVGGALYGGGYIVDLCVVDTAYVPYQCKWFCKLVRKYWGDLLSQQAFEKMAAILLVSTLLACPVSI